LLRSDRNELPTVLGGDLDGFTAATETCMKDGANKTAIAVELFGRSGANLIPLLNGGARALSDATDEATRFGLIVSTEAGRAAEQLNDNLTRLGAVVRGAGAARTRLGFSGGKTAGGCHGRGAMRRQV
jgi:hypothetical protein